MAKDTSKATWSPPGWRSAEHARRAAACGSCPARTGARSCRTGHLRRSTTCSRAARRSRSRSTRTTRSIWCCSPARCRCTTSRSSTARARTAPTTAASASRSATCRRRSTSRSAPTARRWCAARTASAISSSSRRRPRDLDPARGGLHAALRERRTAILMRGAAQPSRAAPQPRPRCRRRARPGCSSAKPRSARYHEQGYLFPIRVLSPRAAAAYRRRLEALRGRRAARSRQALRHKPHLLFTFLDELVRQPARARRRRGRDRAQHPVLGEQLLHQGGAQRELHQLASGPDLLGPGAGRDRDRLDRAQPEHGRERRDAGDPRHPHPGGRAAQGHLRRAQPALARPGDRGRGRRGARRSTWCCSRARCRCTTSSCSTARAPTRSDDRRIGFAVRYLPTHVRQVVGAKDSALLVRGVDSYGHFEPETPPAADLDPAAIAQHKMICGAPGGDPLPGHRPRPALSRPIGNHEPPAQGVQTMLTGQRREFLGAAVALRRRRGVRDRRPAPPSTSGSGSPTGSPTP